MDNKEEQEARLSDEGRGSWAPVLLGCAAVWFTRRFGPREAMPAGAAAQLGTAGWPARRCRWNQKATRARDEGVKGVDVRAGGWRCWGSKGGRGEWAVVRGEARRSCGHQQVVTGLRGVSGGVVQRSASVEAPSLFWCQASAVHGPQASPYLPGRRARPAVPWRCGYPASKRISVHPSHYDSREYGAAGSA